MGTHIVSVGKKPPWHLPEGLVLAAACKNTNDWCKTYETVPPARLYQATFYT